MSVEERQQGVYVVLVSTDPNRTYPAFILEGAVTMG